MLEISTHQLSLESINDKKERRTSSHERQSLMSFVWLLLLDSGNNNAHLAESLSMGQGEADGAILWRRPRSTVQGGSCHQSLRETKKRAKGNDREVVYLCTAPTEPSTFTHIWIRLSSASCVRLYGDWVLPLRSLTSRSLPGKSFSRFSRLFRISASQWWRTATFASWSTSTRAWRGFSAATASARPAGSNTSPQRSWRKACVNPLRAPHTAVIFWWTTLRSWTC